MWIPQLLKLWMASRLWPGLCSTCFHVLALGLINVRVLVELKSILMHLSCSTGIPCMKTVLSLFTQMIDTVTEPGAQPFGVQVKALMDSEARYQPKLSGLRLIETSQDNGLRMTTRLRELEVKDLLSLTRFFGFSSDTFSLAISLLDRFLSVMKVCKYYSLLYLLSWIVNCGEC